MSQLPVIDPLKVANRQVANLTGQLSDSTHREAQLEILAEALRDERDAFHAELKELKNTEQ